MAMLAGARLSARLARPALARLVRPCSASAVPSLAAADFHYTLPPELVAQEAAEPRDAARLLVSLGADERFDGRVSLLPALLPPSTHLVLNHSKVFSARLHAQPIAACDGGGSTGEAAAQAAQGGGGAAGRVEVMFLGPEAVEIDAAAALQRPAHGQVWRAMVRRPLQPGASLAASADVSLHVDAVRRRALSLV